MDSFVDITFPDSKQAWLDNLCPVGALTTWLENDKRGSVISQITPKVRTFFPSSCRTNTNRLKIYQVREEFKEAFLSGPILAKLCYYKTQTEGFASADDQSKPAIQHVFLDCLNTSSTRHSSGVLFYSQTRILWCLPPRGSCPSCFW